MEVILLDWSWEYLPFPLRILEVTQMGDSFLQVNHSNLDAILDQPKVQLLVASKEYVGKKQVLLE